MKVIDGLRIASSNLSRTKFRSFLTVTGVIIGIGSIVMLVSLGVGLQKVTQQQLASFDALTTISVSQKSATGDLEAGKLITDQSIKEMRNLEFVEKVSPTVNYPAQATIGETTSDVLTYGVDPEFVEMESSAITVGTKFKSNTNEAVISAQLAKSTGLENKDILGKELTVKIIQTSAENPLDISQIDLNVTIVGISSDQTANYVYVPLKILQTKTKAESYNNVKVRVTERKKMDIVRKSIDELGYQTGTIKDLIDQIDKIFLLVQIILGAVGGIGLFVASLGIINTMTISLLERTREIGIMKAIGATNKDVNRIFMYESALIGFYGGVLGVGLSWLLGQGVNYLLNFLIHASEKKDQLNVFQTPLGFSLIMICFAIFISLFAGVYPAKRAKNLSPIQALHHE